MTILLMDGFDLYNGIGTNTGLQSGWDAANWFYNPSLVPGRFGGQAFQAGNGDSMIGNGALGGLHTSFGVCCAFRIGNLSLLSQAANATLGAVQLQAGSYNMDNRQLAWRPTLTGRIQVFCGTAMIAQTPAGMLQSGVFHFVEFFGTIGASGSVTVKIDGAVGVAVSGVNTQFVPAINGFDMVLLGNTTGGSGYSQVSGFGGLNLTFDDIYITDGGSLGEARVETLRPTADTVQKDWIPDSGVDNFSRVGATLAQGVNSIHTGVNGALDLYDIANLTNAPAQVYAVSVVTFAQKTDAATRAIAAVADLAGVRIQGANINMGQGIGRYNTIMETKPGGGVWTGTDVNNLKIGPKVTI